MSTAKKLAHLPFLTPYLAVFCLFLLGPLVYGFWLSLHDWHLLEPQKRFVGLANYAGIARDDLFWTAVGNTLRFAAMAVVGGNAVSLLIALGLNMRLRGETLFKVLFYLPTVLSVAVVAVLWRWLYSAEFGLINHYLAAIPPLLGGRGAKPLPWLTDARYAMPSLALMSIWWGAGGGMLIYLAGLRGIPESVYEAALVDGAGGWRRFWSITWPLLKPTTLFNLVIGLAGALQMFGQAFMMTQGGPHWTTLTVAYYMYQNGFSLFKMGYGCAVAYCLFLLALGLAAAQLKLLRYREEPA